MVRNKLVKLEMNKSLGIDAVSNRMLMELCDVISDIVAELYNKSLSTGDVPQDLKMANVTAIFKKGKKLAHLTTDLLV